MEQQSSEMPLNYCSLYRDIGLTEVIDESLLVASELYEVAVDVSQRVGPLHQAIVKAGISFL